mmetsp:Transcript_44722/g.82856  ORF Transcript_44722/g.82856 Transcript_44722/m.82856 type:complete len:113 (-) Transcript_44722:133-471(-)
MVGTFRLQRVALLLGLFLGGFALRSCALDSFDLRENQSSCIIRTKKNEDEALNMNDKKGAKKNDSDDDDNLMSSLEKNDLTELHTTVFEAAAEQHAKLKAFLDSEGLSGHER